MPTDDGTGIWVLFGIFRAGSRESLWGTSRSISTRIPFDTWLRSGFDIRDINQHVLSRRWHVIKCKVQAETTIMRSGREMRLVLHLGSKSKFRGNAVQFISEVVVPGASAAEALGSVMAVLIHGTPALTMLNACKCCQRKSKMLSASIDEGGVIEPDSFDNRESLQPLARRLGTSTRTQCSAKR